MDGTGHPARDERDQGQAQRTGGSADSGGGGTGLDEEMREQLREAGEDAGEGGGTPSAPAPAGARRHRGEDA